MNKQVVTAIAAVVAIAAGVTIARIRAQNKQMRDLKDMQKAVDAFSTKIKSGDFTKELIRNIKNQQILSIRLARAQVMYENKGAVNADIHTRLFRAEELLGNLSKKYDTVMALEIQNEIKKAEQLLTELV